MSRGRSGSFSDARGEERGGSLRDFSGSRFLSSLPAETLSELARALLILGGILTAVVAWAIGGWATPRAAAWLTGSDRFAVDLASRMLEGPTSRDTLVRSHIGAYTRQTAAVFAILGGLFGLLGGVTGGLISRSLPRAAKAGAGGLLFGAIAGGAVCLVIVPIYLGLILRAPDTRISIAAHALTDSSAAGACGFLLALASRAGVRESLRLIAAGVMGASLGALIFGLVQICYFPFESEFMPIPRSSFCRLLEYGCATLVPAVCMAVILRTPPAEGVDGAEEPA